MYKNNIQEQKFDKNILKRFYPARKTMKSDNWIKMSKDKLDKTVGYYDNNAEAWASAHGGYEEKSYWESEMRLCLKPWI